MKITGFKPPLFGVYLWLGIVYYNLPTPDSVAPIPPENPLNKKTKTSKTLYLQGFI